MTRYEKVFVIGLDGADWRLLTPWIQNGQLVTLARLVSEGATGKLRSTIRPESSVAWSTFSTGVNPGKHGVFGFVKRQRGSYGYSLANASSVRARRFWDILGQQGRRVGLVNVPFTYPPAPVNGFLIAGMLTPDTDVPFTHPRDLQRRLLDRFGHYLLDVDESVQDKALLIDQVRALTHQHQETILFMLEDQPWDVFVAVFTGPDRLQHFIWAEMDPQHPLYDEASAQLYARALLEHYQELDAAIALILDHLPPATLVLLMSDHGFNGCGRRFFVNRWLQNEGYLKLGKTATWRSHLAPWLLKLGGLGGLRRLKRAVLGHRGSSMSLRSAVFTQAIDWVQTRAFFGLDGGLRINLIGREPHGIVQPGAEFESLRHELREALLALRDPTTKQPVLSEVFLRQELYHGPFAPDAPDLILEPQRENHNPSFNVVLDGSLRTQSADVMGSAAPYSANHALDGILVAWGPAVASGTHISNAGIADLAPTILAALGVAVPDYMDGRVLSEIFLPGQAPPLKYVSALESSPSDHSAESFTPRDEATVEARLRDLGYLD